MFGQDLWLDVDADDLLVEVAMQCVCVNIRWQRCSDYVYWSEWDWTDATDGDADAVVKARIHSGWFKLWSPVSFTVEDVFLKLRGKVYSACMRSSMLHGSETWLMKRETKLALQWV